METKTHYRNVYKSDHLGVADLEDMIEKGEDLIFKVKQVKQEIGVKVAGRKGNHNIAYFEGNHKPFVLNAGNSKIMKKFSKGSPFVEDWTNALIELYIDPSVTFGGEKTGGVKIKPEQPKAQKPVLTPDHRRWDKAKEAVLNGKESAVLKQFQISQPHLELLRKI